MPRRPSPPAPTWSPGGEAVGDYMMRNAQSLAASAARKMLRIVVEAVDSKSNAVLPSLLAPLHAPSTLAMHAARHTHHPPGLPHLDHGPSSPSFLNSSDSMREIYVRLRSDGLLDLWLQKLDFLVQEGVPPSVVVVEPSYRLTNGLPTHVPRAAPETPCHRTTPEECAWSGGGGPRAGRTGSAGNGPASPSSGPGSSRCTGSCWPADFGLILFRRRRF
ncbi:hypothetical protein CTA1_10602 [Colletotrichum tanaceti]|uniref:Uncharacterized protein n=1 Tax=Colletotrichum tanaceti TaxID=1306861 RepID=A0A4U6X890_9PEZI|nr:hypothetical protein CTA1_10602 [Colletotrichum tanaceti]